MEVTCWSDYLCPWCYVGLDRSRRMAAQGLQVVHLPYELHPEIPPGGRRVRAEGRLATTHERVAAECAAAGLAFRPPTRMGNTHLALASAEWVRVHHPAAFESLHAGLFHAHFAEGLALDDPDVVGALVAAAGAPPAEVHDAATDGRADALLDQARSRALEHGVGSTPTWVFPDGFQIPGALDGATVDRWVTKILARSSSPERPDR